MEDDAQPRYFVRGLERTINVFTAFGESPEMTISEIAERTGLDRATARRILLSLVDLGYAEKDNKVFRLRPRILRIGFSYLNYLGVSLRGQHVLETLTSETKQASGISVLDGHEIVYVARSSIPGLESLASALGTRYPAHATAMGRVLLAALPPEELDDYFHFATLESFTRNTLTSKTQLRNALKTVREEGYAQIEDELGVGVSAIAVPIVKQAGRVVAAMFLSTRGASMELVASQYLPKLRHAAALLSQR